MSNLFPSQAHGNLLVTTLRTLGVTQVRVDFDGQGDSGSVECVTFLGAEEGGLDVSRHDVVWPNKHDAWDAESQMWSVCSKDDKQTLEQIFIDLAYEALATGDVPDWVNNEGGYGTLFINLDRTPVEIYIDMNQRITTTQHTRHDFWGPQNHDGE